MKGMENLKPFNELDIEEHRKISKKGGKASGEARRRKKTLREQAETFLSLGITEDNLKKTLVKMGVENDDQTRAMAMIVAMWQSCMDGNVGAFKSLLELVGERVVGLDVNAEVNNPLAELSTEELKKMIKND